MGQGRRPGRLIAYFDSSALARMILDDEEGSEPAARLWGRADRATASRVVEPEVRGALAAAVRDGRRSSRQRSRDIEQLRGYLDEIYFVELVAGIARFAGDLAERHALSGFDAAHLASAIAVDPDVTLVTFDNRLARAAHDEGLAVAPPIA